MARDNRESPQKDTRDNREVPQRDNIFGFVFGFLSGKKEMMLCAIVFYVFFKVVSGRTRSSDAELYLRFATCRHFANSMKAYGSEMWQILAQIWNPDLARLGQWLCRSSGPVQWLSRKTSPSWKHNMFCVFL